MFELEEFSSGYHSNKYADSCNPSLDFYITDSLQDMLDIDIRSEIATVVGGSNDFSSMVGDLPASFDYSIDAISSINNSSSLNAANTNNLHASTSSASSALSSWFGSNGGNSWSASANSDFYADVGACVNPISVMPMITSSVLHNSPKTNLNAIGRISATSPTRASPNGSEAKSHLTFSPARMKVGAGALRNEHLHSRIPKQLVSISSTVTAATTAPATMATNSVLQRKTNTAIEAIKKDLGAELRKSTADSKISSNSHKNGNGLMNGNTTNTIKLAPGIGGLTFANSIAYNKLKQQSGVKSPQGSPVTTNGTIMLKRDRDSSPLHNITSLNVNGGGQHITKILARKIVQMGTNYTPQSIASAKSPLLQNGSNANNGSSMSSTTAATSATSSASSSTNNNNFNAGLAPISNNNYFSAVSSASSTSSMSSSNTITSIAVKSLQQKIKIAPVESEYPKPAYSYSCLIAMALKNSRSGSLPVSEIYSFMCEHFPYFKTAPSGWKNSVRHNLSLNKCFEKIEKPVANGNQRKGCLWAMNPDRIIKMDEEVQKWSRKDPSAIRCAMVFPEHLEALERGEMKHGSTNDSDAELDSQSEIEETSDLEEQELDETIVDNMYVEEDIEDEDVSNSIVVYNATERTIINPHNRTITENDTEVDVEDDDENIVLSQQQHHRDFDIEVEDFYDAIDLEDDKESVRLAINQSDIIELSPSEMNTQQQQQNNGYESPKRARLNVNYSIGPAGELEKQIIKQQQRQQQLQNIKHVKVQQLHQQQLNQKYQQQQQQQQHIVVQTISNVNTNTIQTAPAQFTQITAIPSHNRRKMQLVSRIA